MSDDASQQKIEALEQEVKRLEKVTQALMKRVERGMDMQGDAYALFQSATALEHKVRERTQAYQGAMRDLERSNRELLDAKEAAEAGSRAKSEFLATMSHEIRTPMNGVLGLTELLLSSGLDDKQKGIAEMVYRSGESLLHIINDILDFSKVEAGKLELEEQPFELKAIVDIVPEMLGEMARAKQIELRCDLMPDVPTHLIGDPTRLRQLLINLVGNGVKFTEQGKVVLRVSADRILDTTVAVRFEVEDTGVGIPESALSGIFDAFEQADGSTTRKFGGTGLGLAICRRLVELMDGQIGATSELGQGSKFWFTAELAIDASTVEPVPAAHHKIDSMETGPIKSPSSHSPTTPKVEPSLNVRILVAEDNHVNQVLAKGMLQKLGCDAIMASNGIEALEAIQQTNFDLVMMDCQMPELDGYETTRRIRELESTDGLTRTPIIALTANALKGDREKALDAGMDDYLSKPFSKDQLRAVLTNWIKQEAA